MFNRKRIVLATAVLVGITAVIHILLGLYGIGEWFVSGELSSELAPLFLLSGVVILIGMSGVYRGNLTPRPAYAFGAIMMGIYLIGYADWHALGYAETLLGLEDAGHNSDQSAHDHNGHDHGDHGHGDDSALTTIADHLRTDPVALACKTSETVSAALLTALAVTRQR